MKRVKNFERFLIPSLVLLFILQVLLLPAALGVTFASRSVNPEHTLTYTPGSLEFDSDTELYENGSAKLSLFETAYQNAEAQNGQKIIAPGTDKNSIIRLKNESGGEISYTAVLWSKDTAAERTAAVSLSGDGFSDAENALLPSDIDQNSVIRAVSGTVSSKNVQDFDINWVWDFENQQNSVARDKIDTALGNKSADGNPDELTVGFYIIVNDGNSYVTPEIPKTGDKSAVWGFGACFVLSLCIISGLVIDRRKAKKYEN